MRTTRRSALTPMGPNGLPRVAECDNVRAPGALRPTLNKLGIPSESDLAVAEADALARLDKEFGRA